MGRKSGRKLGRNGRNNGNDTATGYAPSPKDVPHPKLSIVPPPELAETNPLDNRPPPRECLRLPREAAAVEREELASAGAAGKRCVQVAEIRYPMSTWLRVLNAANEQRISASEFVRRATTLSLRLAADGLMASIREAAKLARMAPDDWIRQACMGGVAAYRAVIDAGIDTDGSIAVESVGNSCVGDGVIPAHDPKAPLRVHG